MKDPARNVDPIAHALEEYFEEYRASVDEVLMLEQRRTSIDKKLARLRMKMAALATLVEGIPEGSELDRCLREIQGMGLTEAIREVMKASEEGMTPMQVRDALLRIGYDLSGYKNVQAIIHTTLKRLRKSGMVDQAYDSKTKKPLGIYRWSPFQGVYKYRIMPDGTLIDTAESSPEIIAKDIAIAGEGLIESMRRASALPDKSMIDLFSGQGSAPNKKDIIVANPPYASAKKAGRIQSRGKKKG